MDASRQIQRPSIVCSILIVVALGFGCPMVGAQSLSKLRSEVRESDSEPSSDSDRSRKRRESGGNRPRHEKYGSSNSSKSQFGPSQFGSNLDDDCAAEQLAGYAFLAGVTSPIWVPRLAVQDEGLDAAFPRYPYHPSGNGALLFDSELPGAHDALMVLQGDYGTDFDALQSGHVRLFGEIWSRFGFDTEAYFRKEKLSIGNDHLSNGDFNLTYRFAQSPKWQFRAGLGVNWLADSIGRDAGINTTYGCEWFPTDPIVVSNMIDWGRLGKSGLFHYRGTVGVTRKGWGIFTGYDYLNVGDSKIQSWINGIEYRF